MTDSGVYQFTVEIDRLVKDLPADEVRDVQQHISDVASELLIKRTPVGNPEAWAANIGKTRGSKGYVGRDYIGGHAKANWQVAINAIPTDEISGVDADGGATKRRADAVIAEIPPYSLTVIANSVPYIERLEEGHSTQAPAGMLALTFAELQDGLQTVAAP